MDQSTGNHFGPYIELRKCKNCGHYPNRQDAFDLPVCPKCGQDGVLWHCAEIGRWERVPPENPTWYQWFIFKLFGKGYTYRWHKKKNEE